MVFGILSEVYRIKIIEYFRARNKHSLNVNLVVLLNLVIFVEAFLTVISTIFVQIGAARTCYWWVVLILSVSLAELALHDAWRKLASSVTVYAYSVLLLPIWALIHGSFALSGVVYLVTLLLVLNMVATKIQRWIINPFMFFFMVGFLSYEYYNDNFIAVIPIDGEMALYYIVIIPIAMMIGMAIVVALTDTYKKEHALLEEKNKELQRMMRIDMLTGLYNKQFLNEQIKIYMAISKRNEIPLSVIVIDIDYFKNYNDMYGHIQGDRCLVRVAEIMNDSVLRDSDSVFRFGGEEFVVLLHNIEQSAAKVVGQRIVDNIRAANIKNEGSEVESVVTVSVGLYTFDGKKDMTTNSVIRMADEALYQAKNGGRNRLCAL